jgi:hypothetical protein
MNNMTTTVLVFASILLLLSSVLFIKSIEATHATTSIVSTRDDFDLFTGTMFFGQRSSHYEPPQDIPACSSDREIVVYVHGWNADKESAISQFNIVKKSLESPEIDYRHPVIGFSWDSDTLGFPPWNWVIGKSIAEKNGLKLGKFILDFKEYCEQAKIRLVSHSLGAKVILNALERLHNDPELSLWNAPDKNYKVESVHFLGAAVNPEDISSGNGFGLYIRNEVNQNQFHNKFSPQDDTLETAYRDTEGHIALGENGAENLLTELSNYYQEENVSTEISRDVNGNGILDRNDKPNLGDDHMGYAGVVNRNNGELTSNGAIDLVVEDWKNNQ